MSKLTWLTPNKLSSFRRSLTLTGLVLLLWAGFSVAAMAAPKILTPSDAYRFAYQEIGRLTHEEARAFFVDKDGNLLKESETTQKQKAELYYVPWELVVPGQLPKGTAIIYVVHNHPGNHNWLSEGDVEVGSYWAAKAAERGIYLDLLAITPDRGYASLRESGLLRPLSKEDKGLNGYMSYVVDPATSIAEYRLKGRLDD